MSAWLFYALLAPLLFAFVNVFDKFLREKHLGTFSLSVFVGLGGFWVLAMMPFVELDFSPVIVIGGLIAGLMFFLNAFPYFQALAIEEASRVIPLWAFEAPMVLILAFVFLKERLAINDYVGFILVVVGAFLVLTKKLSDVLKPGRAFFLMLLASSLTSVGIVLSKWLYSETSYWTVQFLMGLGPGSAALLALVVLSGKRKMFVTELKRLRKATVLQLGLRQLTITAGFLVFGLALTTGSASLSAALIQLAALFVFIIATVLSHWWPSVLKEAIDKKALLTKAVAIAMVIAGVFAINL
ncbi:MAG: EamA family transporter [Nanoarchaeota archaeon]